MSATLQRRHTAADAPAVQHDETPRRQTLLLVATLTLLVAACLPLTRVYVGLAFLRPVLGSVLLAVGLGWGARRVGSGPVTALLTSVVGWIAFCSAAFFADTLYRGVVPTAATLAAGLELWVRGLELMRLRPAPAFAEPGLLFVTVTGVWAVAHAVEGLVFRLHAPIKASAMALVLWVVPLALAPAGGAVWPWTVPFLATAALLLLAFSGTDLGRWGTWVGTTTAERTTLLPAGGAIAVCAIIAGLLLAGVLPGFRQAPWYELRGIGGTTLTTNPIVDIRTRLVASDTGPVMRVRSDRPVYLRTTSLDVYNDSEEWTNSGISGAPVNGLVPFEVALGPAEQVLVDVEVVELPQAVLVPAPYQVVNVRGPAADVFQYDQGISTLTVDAGTTLSAGDEYSVTAAIPAPAPEQLDGARSFAPDGALTELPGTVPPAVAELAGDVVERAEARTPFQQALAIQQELRTWTYSTSPPQGHGGQAMESFLATRTGYCEQFAGTMAVMLRSLDIPARVAVGYTPGRLVDAEQGEYVITNANAHAWVEVLFPGLGWIAFEPTPRADGNVLVPTAQNLAPSRTVAEGDLSDFQSLGSAPNLDLIPSAPAERFPDDAPRGLEDDRDGGGTAQRWSLLPLLLFALVGTALVVGGVATARGRAATQPSSSERVLRAREGVERVGRGLRVPPAPSETDHEYLQRLAERHAPDAVRAARALGGHAAGARYASALPQDAADEAEQAAARLRERLLAGLAPWRRALVGTRGPLSSAAVRLRRRVTRMLRRRR